jgi:hypothetical protein
MTASLCNVPFKGRTEDLSIKISLYFVKFWNFHQLLRIILLISPVLLITRLPILILCIFAIFFTVDTCSIFTSVKLSSTSFSLSENFLVNSRLVFFVGYLMTLSVARLYSIKWLDDR